MATSSSGQYRCEGQHAAVLGVAERCAALQSARHASTLQPWHTVATSKTTATRLQLPHSCSTEKPPRCTPAPHLYSVRSAPACMAPSSSASAAAAAAAAAAEASPAGPPSCSPSAVISSTPAAAAPRPSLGTIGASPSGGRSGLAGGGAASSTGAPRCSGLGGRRAGLGPTVAVEAALLAASGDSSGRCIMGPAEAGRRSGEGFSAASVLERPRGE